MITITNWWGIFFSIWLPMILLSICSFYAGIEEAEERHKKRVVHGKCNYSNYP